MGKPILMGRKTFESLGKSLPGRKNLVISKQGDLTADGCDIFENIEDALAEYNASEEIMIIGGASIYQQALPLTDRMYLTLIEQNFDGDAHFPIFDATEWIEMHNRKFVGAGAIPYRNIILDRNMGAK